MGRVYTGILVFSLLFLTACGAAEPSATPPPPTPTTVAGADLSAIKTYLLDKAAQLKSGTTALKGTSDRYYTLVQGANNDYTALWKQPAPVIEVIQQAQAQWIAASPRYEQIEGIVGGVPSLAEYDVILDAGSSASAGGDNVVPFDLTLPDGRVLPKPGNLFGVTESALWGTFADFTAPGVTPDFNNNGTLDFGEALPEANILKAAVDALDSYAGQLLDAAKAWTPTESDAFTAMVVMTPTMTELFDSWKASRFVAAAGTAERDFGVISRLSDIKDILSSLQVIYAGLSPRVRTVDAAQDGQIAQRLTDLHTFVAGIYEKEQGGKRYTPEEADLLGGDAQDRATAIAGQLTQLAAQLGVPLQQ
jgi:hypothetical protein